MSISASGWPGTAACSMVAIWARIAAASRSICSVTCYNAFPSSAASFAIASLFSMGTPRPSVCAPAEALFVVLI